MPKRRYYVETERGIEAVKNILSTRSCSTFTEYLEENMELFLKSRKNTREIYTILKEKAIFEGSYSWFKRLFKRGKSRILEKLKNNNTEMDGGREENQAILKELFSTKENHFSMEGISGNREKEEEKEEKEKEKEDVPQEYKLKMRADIEVPIDEIQEAINAGAKIDSQWGEYTGILYAPGNRDARRFQKWLTRRACEKYKLEYREKGKIATKTEVLELIPKLNLIFEKGREQ